MPLPPFRYNAYQDPYVEDITSLMGQPSAIQAQSVREIGGIRAEEALQKGAATAQMIGSLGQITQQGYAGYQDEKADAIYDELVNSGEAHSDYALYQTEAEGMPETTPEAIPEATPVIGAYPQTGPQWDELYGGIPMPPGDEAVSIPSAETGAGTLADIPGAIPEAEPYRGRKEKYRTNDKRHDVAALRQELSKRGVSPRQIQRLIAEATEHNASITAFTAENDRRRETDEATNHDLIITDLVARGLTSRDDFIEALGAKKGLETYQAWISLEALESQLRTAKSEELFALFKKMSVVIPLLVSTGQAQDSVIKGMVEQLRPHLGDEATDALAAGGMEALTTLIQQFEEPQDPTENFPDEHFYWTQIRNQYPVGSDEYNAANIKVEQAAAGIREIESLTRDPEKAPDNREKVNAIHRWYWTEKRKLEEIARKATQDPDMFKDLIGEASQTSPVLAMMLASDLKGDAPLDPGWLEAKLAELEIFRDQRLSAYPQQGAPAAGQTDDPFQQAILEMWPQPVQTPVPTPGVDEGTLVPPSLAPFRHWQPQLTETDSGPPESLTPPPVVTSQETPVPPVPPNRALFGTYQRPIQVKQTAAVQPGLTQAPTPESLPLARREPPKRTRSVSIVPTRGDETSDYYSRRSIQREAVLDKEFTKREENRTKRIAELLEWEADLLSGKRTGFPPGLGKSPEAHSSHWDSRITHERVGRRLTERDKKENARVRREYALKAVRRVLDAYGATVLPSGDTLSSPPTQPGMY